MLKSSLVEGLRNSRERRHRSGTNAFSLVAEIDSVSDSVRSLPSFDGRACLFSLPKGFRFPLGMSRPLSRKCSSRNPVEGCGSAPTPHDTAEKQRCPRFYFKALWIYIVRQRKPTKCFFYQHVLLTKFSRKTRRRYNSSQAHSVKTLATKYAALSSLSLSLPCQQNTKPRM